jgi:hypothetical protein
MYVMGGKDQLPVDRMRLRRRSGAARGVVAMLAASLALSSCQTLFE